MADQSFASPLPKPIDKQLKTYWEEYFCGSDVVMLIGDTIVDDVVTIQYTKVNNKSPIYGYMSEYFDAVAKGTIIVQGEFAIAFRENDYIKKILDRHKSHSVQNLESIDLNNPNIPEIKYENVSGEIDSLNSTNSPDRYGYNSLYVDPDGFEIVIVFGDPSGENRSGTVETISGVHITSISKACQPTGEPIAEVYSFFGRMLNDYQPNLKYDIENEPTIQEITGETPSSVVVSSNNTAQYSGWEFYAELLDISVQGSTDYNKYLAWIQDAHIDPICMDGDLKQFAVWMRTVNGVNGVNGVAEYKLATQKQLIEICTMLGYEILYNDSKEPIVDPIVKLSGARYVNYKAKIEAAAAASTE